MKICFLPFIEQKGIVILFIKDLYDLLHVYRYFELSVLIHREFCLLIQFTLLNFTFCYINRGPDFIII